MPKRTDISSILVIGAGLCLAACGEDQATKAVTIENIEPTKTVAACIAKFEQSANEWANEDVSGSFVYDLSALDGDKAEEFMGGDPAKMGGHSIIISDVDADQAKADFLERDPSGDSAALQVGDLTLLRVNEPRGSFGDVLRRGCARVRVDAPLIQVTFSQGVF